MQVEISLGSVTSVQHVWRFIAQSVLNKRVKKSWTGANRLFCLHELLLQTRSLYLSLRS